MFSISKIVVISFFLSILYQLSYAQEENTGPSSVSIGYPVLSGGDTLFYIHTNSGGISAEKRAEAVTKRIDEIAKDESVVIDSIKLDAYEGVYEITANEIVLFHVSKKDAQFTGGSLDSLAITYFARTKEALIERRTDYSSDTVLRNGLYTALILILFIILIWISIKILTLIIKKIEVIKTTSLRPLGVKTVELLSSESIAAILAGGARLILFVIIATVFYNALTFIIEIWPVTKGLNLLPFLGGVFRFLIYSFFLFLLLRGLSYLKTTLGDKTEAMKGTVVKSVTMRGIEVLSENRLMTMVHSSIKSLFVVLWISVVYTYLTLIFGLFTFSKDWSAALIGFVLTPIVTMTKSIINFLPNIFFIIVITVVFYYFNKVIRFIFNEIERGSLHINGFFPEWSKPTYKVVRFLIIVLAVISIFPYLPGSDSPIFQGISVFVGILLSLGSTSAIANVVAGVVLTYMRPFKIGDRVKIADTMGDVLEKTLLVTRIRTTKNVDITVPNSMVLSNHIINFSSAATDPGLILNTTITIGYDAPWSKVHELLISAALETEGVISLPAPFVLQTALNDFSVAYELNAYTNQPGRMAGLYSDLHAKIQDKFNEAGVEIMSPIYNAVRDGNQSTIPEDHLPKDYKKPSFNIFKQS